MKYCELEIERRWLVDESLLPDLSKLRSKQLEDKYLDGTRLRLRKEASSSSSSFRYKLCKKYGKTGAITEPITNIYLDETEFMLLSAMQGRTVYRTRFYYLYNGHSLSINIGEGLPTIVEAEFQTEDDARQFQAPDFCTREVSQQESYEMAKLAAQ